MSYNFQEQLNDNRQDLGLKEVIKILQAGGEKIKDVSKDQNYFSRGIDLIRFTPEEEYIDVKTDFKAHETGNIPIELIEVCPINNSNIKLGWYFSEVHTIIFYIWELKTTYKLSKSTMKDLTLKLRKGYASHHKKPFPYYTLGVLIPLIELEAYRI